MIKIELDQLGSDECGRLSRTTLPRDADTRLSRDRSRTDCSKDGSEFWDTWRRGGMAGSISPSKDFGAEKCRKEGKRTCLPMKHELKEEEIPRESKRVRYSNHHSKAHSKDSLEGHHRSHERVPRRHGTNSQREEKHELLKSCRFSTSEVLKGKCQSNATSNYAGHALSNGGKPMKDESREMIHHRRDAHASLGHREHHRDTGVTPERFSEGHCQKGEVYSSSSPLKPQDRPDNHSQDHKHDYNAEHNINLSRNGSPSGLRYTCEADRSSKWRSNDDRQVCHLERNTSSSWNEPKLGEETANKDAPNSLKRNTENVLGVHDVKTDAAFSRNVPTWGDKATSENAPQLSKWRSGTDNHARDKDADINLPCTGPKWGKRNSNDGPRSCRSSTTEWDPWETRNNSSRNGPKWDDRATAKDTPASSQGRLDADKWDSKVKTNNCSTWNGPKCSDETNTNVAANFSKLKSVDETNKSLSHTGPKYIDKTDSKDAPRLRRSSGTKWDSKQTTCNSPWDGKKGDGATIKDAPGSSQWRSDVDDWGSKVKTSNSSMLNVPKFVDEITTKDGPKWGDATNAKDAPQRSSNTGWDPWETKNSTSQNGPNWNDRATNRDAPGSLQCRSDVNKWGSNVKTDNSSSRAGSKWNDKTNAKNASCLMTSSNTDWDPWETKNSSRNGRNRDDRATTQDARCSSQWISDVDKGGSNVKTDKCSSWMGPKLGDKTNAMDAPHSRRLTNTDRDPCEAKNNSSWNGPNQDDRAITKDAPSSSRWRSDVDKWGSNVKTGNRSSQTDSKWGEKTNANDASRSRRSSNTVWDPWETTCSSSRNGPNRDDMATTKYPPGFSQRRSDVDRRGSTVKIENYSSWTDPKCGDKTNLMDAPRSRRSSNTDCDPWEAKNNNSSRNGPHREDRAIIKDASKTDWDPWEAKNNNSSRNGPNREDRAITKDAHGSLQWRSDADKCGASVKTDNCSTKNGPKWGDETTSEGVFDSSRWTNADRQGYKVKTDNILTCKGPKWGDQTAAKSMPDSSGCRPDNEKHANNAENRKTSLNVPEWDDHITTKDAPKSSKQRSDGDDGNCGRKIGDSFSWGSRTGDRSSTKDIPNFSQHYADGERNCSVKDNSRSSEIGAKLVGQTFTIPAARFSCCRSDAVRWGSTGTDNMNSMQNSFTSKAKPGNEKRDYNLKPGDNFSSVAPELKNQLPAEVTPSDFQQRTHDCKDRGLKTDGGLLQKGSRQGDQTITREAAKLRGDAAIGLQTGHAKKEQSVCHRTAERDVRKIQEINKEDVEGIRMFKFALAGFAKNILKPIWKEGHLSKEAHKTIVKKVVDKVIGAMQGADIPRTHRNIDLYIAYSKTKLTNLVQAYLERCATSCSRVDKSDRDIGVDMGSEGKMSAQSSAV